MWLILKTIHVTTVLITMSLFVLRGVWLRRDPAVLQQRWVRIAPHTNDSLLLASAIGLALATHQYPGPQAWLTAKVIGLLAYIGLGLVAFRFARSERARTAAWLAALAVLAYIIAVAVTRHVWVVAG